MSISTKGILQIQELEALGEETIVGELLSVRQLVAPLAGSGNKRAAARGREFLTPQLLQLSQLLGGANLTAQAEYAIQAGVLPKAPA